MQSPKFPLKRLDIEEIINPGRLRSRWTEKVRDAMRHQPISDPVKHLDFHVRLDAMCKSIAAEVCSGQYIPRPPIRFLSEKSKGMCRQLVIPSAKDCLVLQTLSDALWADLKEKAPAPKNAFYAPHDHQFSKVVHGEVAEYGPLGPWLAFQRRILGFAKTRNFVVVTDIANFYDGISYNHLRHILAGLSIAKEHSLDLLIYVLSAMLWQPDYMQRVEIGLPQINLDAPRLLAHCFLFEIDRFLVAKTGTDFARYMDDIDLGADTIAEAKRLLRDLDLALQTRQLRLNAGKTIILTDAEARRHFCVRENAFLTRFERAARTKLSQEKMIKRERRFIEHAIHVGLRGRFKTGNGEKILKRLINYAREFKAGIRDDDFAVIISNYPACRSNLLQWWQHSDKPNDRLHLLRDFVKSHEIVDDHALIAVANSLVAARLTAEGTANDLVQEICSNFSGSPEWGLYARLWVLSKYGTSGEILGAIESSFSIWIADEQLSRLVAGMSPRLRGTAQFKKFQGLVSRSGNPWCQSVMDFHDALATSASGFRSVHKFIRALNPSQPSGISHAKFLMLLGAMKNSLIPGATRMTLRNQHALALTDQTYAKLLPALTSGAQQAA